MSFCNSASYDIGKNLGPILILLLSDSGSTVYNMTNTVVVLAIVISHR